MAFNILCDYRSPYKGTLLESLIVSIESEVSWANCDSDEGPSVAPGPLLITLHFHDLTKETPPLSLGKCPWVAARKFGQVLPV